MPSSHHHRAGGLRQSNKKNKRSKASKRSLAVRAGAGKVAGGASNKQSKTTAHAMAAQSKANRRNHQQQKRDAQRQARLRQRRGMTTTDSGLGGNATARPPPRVVGIVSLGEVALEERVRAFLVSGADRVVTSPQSQYSDQDSTSAAAAAATPMTTRTITCQFDVHKRDGAVTVLTAGTAFASGNVEVDDDAALVAALDLARVCDTLLFVIDSDRPQLHHDDAIMGIEIGADASVSTTRTSKTHKTDAWDHLISARGDRILAALKGQGLPTPLTVLARTAATDGDDHATMQSVKSVRRSQLKRHLELKRYVSRLATTEFGNDHDKVVEIDLSVMNATTTANSSSTAEDRRAASAPLVRTVCTMGCAPAKWVSQSPARPYLLADAFQYDATTRQLQLTGHMRGGSPWDVHALVHVPGLGTYACRSITQATAPLQQFRRRGGGGGGGMEAFSIESKLVVVADPSQREPLDMYAAPDALEGEQNLIGFDEDEDLEDVHDEEPAMARPAGWSDYQSAWLDAFDEGENNDNDDSNNDRGELAQELNRKSGAGATTSASSIATDAMDLDVDDANQVSATERQALMEERQKQQSEENDFPDEVQVGEDEKARDRFARYRSLKSFRKSHWDAKENLPDSFASIYHFSSFKQTQRSVMNDMKELAREAEAVKGNFFGKSPPKTDNSSTTDAMEVQCDEDDVDFLEGCVPSGSYVTLTLEQVPNDVMSTVAPNSLLCAVALLPHENKVSVLHMGLSQTTGCDPTDGELAIKSKDVLTFRCGWRTWKARPVFSQNNLNCDKHKFERFLPTGGAFFAASVFGPVTYTPCPVLVFREKNLVAGVQKRELVAIGSMMGADADRIVVKRIILTGYPVRVHKRHATVKYMFYDPEDVKWFKPAGLHTKHGLQGNIVQSVGEHGTMKCLFNAPIKQHDTVCLPLYKRIYPKYAPAEGDEKALEKGTETYKESFSLVVR